VPRSRSECFDLLVEAVDPLLLFGVFANKLMEDSFTRVLSAAAKLSKYPYSCSKVDRGESWVSAVLAINAGAGAQADDAAAAVLNVSLRPAAALRSH